MKTINVNEINSNQNLFLTTVDNSFDPFKDFLSWWKEDLRLGYDCCGLLARTSNISDIASDEVNNSLIVQAMQEIVQENPLIYKVVAEN